MINPKILTLVRLIITAYLSAVAGVSMKYKLNTEDSHTNWRIPFQFSTVTFSMLLAYNIQVTVSSASLIHGPIRFDTVD